MSPFVPAVDTHAHVFDRTCHLVEDRRYTPDYEAAIGNYLARLDREGITYGVLVQPSFLGTDNSYLLGALRAHPDRLRGIAVVDPGITDAGLDTLGEAGVIGLRYNLFGRDPHEVAQPETRRLTARAAERGWLIEIHTPGPTLPSVLDAILGEGAHAVVHHFGRPEHGPDDPGFARLLTCGRGDPVWVKLSAAYRLGGADAGALARALLETPGPERLLWGSDWPWTEHEDQVTDRGCLDDLAAWLGGSADLLARIDRTSRDLYGFAGVPA